MDEFSQFVEYGSMGVLVLVLIGVYLKDAKAAEASRENTRILAENTEVIRSFREELRLHREILLQAVSALKEYAKSRNG